MTPTSSRGERRHRRFRRPSIRRAIASTGRWPGPRNLLLLQPGHSRRASGTGQRAEQRIDARAYDHSARGRTPQRTRSSPARTATLRRERNTSLHGTKSILSRGAGNDTILWQRTNTVLFDVARAANADLVMDSEFVELDATPLPTSGLRVRSRRATCASSPAPGRLRPRCR